MGGLKQPVEFLPNLVEQTDVDLMVQKHVHLQNIVAQDLTVTENPLFQKLHKFMPILFRIIQKPVFQMICPYSKLLQRFRRETEKAAD